MRRPKEKPSYKRQQYLLELVAQHAEGIAQEDLQGLAFLHLRREQLDHYEFIVREGRVHSFQLAHDLEILQRDGFLEEVGAGFFRATGPAGEAWNLADERGDELVKRLLQTHAEFFDRPEIEEHGSVLYTIGYEGRSLEAVIQMLQAAGVALVCDVRANPQSRKFGFAKRTLQEALEHVGLAYVHLPELGIATDARRTTETAEDYAELFARYADELPQRQAAIDELFALLDQYQRAALLCFERESEHCHRHYLRNYLLAQRDLISRDL